MEVKITDFFAVETAEEAAARPCIRPDLPAKRPLGKPKVGRPRKHARIEQQPAAVASQQPTAVANQQPSTSDGATGQCQ